MAKRQICKVWDPNNPPKDSEDCFGRRYSTTSCCCQGQAGRNPNDRRRFGACIIRKECAKATRDHLKKIRKDLGIK